MAAKKVCKKQGRTSNKNSGGGVGLFSVAIIYTLADNIEYLLTNELIE